MIDDLEGVFEGHISEGDCRWVILHLEPNTYTVVEPRMKLMLIKLHPNS